MKSRDPRLPPELEAFLEHRPIQRHAPPELRARALARARAILAPGPATSTAPPAPLQVPPPSVEPVHVRFRIALAVVVAVASGAVGAVAALHGRWAHTPTMTAPESLPPIRNIPLARAGSPSPQPPTPDTTHVAAAAASRPARTTPREDPLGAELELLQRAHAAYSRRDFPVALTLVTEHARRFPRGQLAEQREALRVRSLIGSGRIDEAHRVAVAFAARFPRSVLLQQLEGSAEFPEP